MTQLNGKIMEQKLKEGWTLSDLANYLNCSKDEAEIKIKSTFSEKAAKSMLRKMRQNGKNKNKQIDSRVNNDKDAKENVVDDDKQLSNEEILLQKKDELLDLVMKEEKILQDQISYKSSLTKSLAEEKMELENIKRLVIEKKKKVNKLISKFNETQEKIVESSNALEYFKTLLNKVQNDIKELYKLTIFVYNSGSIEAEEYDFNVLEYHSKYEEIMSNYSDILEDLTIKQCKQLAQLLSFIETIDDRAFEIVFESETFQNAYNALTSENSKK